MMYALSALTCWLVVAGGVVENATTQPAATASVAALQRENAALRARVAELEAELERLRSDNRQLNVLAGLTPPEDAAEAEAVKVVTQKDPATGATTVGFKYERMEVVSGSRSQHWMRLAYVQGADGAAPRQVDLHILAMLTQGDYRQLGQARLIVGGESVAVAVKDYKRQVRGGGVAGRETCDEELTVVVPLEVVARVAGARDVQLRLRQVQLKLSASQIAQFKALQERMKGA